MDISKVAIVMGSSSDLEVVTPCLRTLAALNIGIDARILSAHRTPHEAHEFAMNAKDEGIEIIIAVAGKAAHLAGVIASLTILPVIALPVSTKMMGGLDSLLSMVQMPKGVPVATVGIDAGENAAILAAQILAVKYPKIGESLADFKTTISQQVNNDNRNLQKMLPSIINSEG